MMVIKFRSSEDHSDLMHKVKKMRKFTEELEDILNDCYEDDEPEYRGSYRRMYDEDDMRMEGRYGYRRGYRRGM
jgi:hypothetical protein